MDSLVTIGIKNMGVKFLKGTRCDSIIFENSIRKPKNFKRYMVLINANGRNNRKNNLRLKCPFSSLYIKNYYNPLSPCYPITSL